MNFKIDHNSYEPLHIQLEKIFRDLIKQDEYIEGKLLPKEAEIANELGISRNTVRQAINKLVIEGLITRKKGVGSKVNQNYVHTYEHNFGKFSKECIEFDSLLTNYKISVKKMSNNDKIANLLGIQSESNIITIIKLSGNAKEPYVLSFSYFHPRIGLQETDDFTQPHYLLLKNHYYTKISKITENIKAIAAPAGIAKQLNISINSPILYQERISYDPGDRIIEYNLRYYKADKMTYSISTKENSSK